MTKILAMKQMKQISELVGIYRQVILGSGPSKIESNSVFKGLFSLMMLIHYINDLN